MNSRRVLIASAIVFCWFSSSPPAHAQQPPTLADSPSITRGYSAGGPSAGVPFQAGYTAGSYGSISQPKTTDGYTITAFYDSVRGGKIGACVSTFLTISGFTADPGQGWLVSAAANTVNFSGPSANYTYSNGAATWRWGCGLAFINANGPVTTTIVHGGDAGYLDLKFQVLGVDYAPPGAQSTVNYSQSVMRGTQTTNSATFKSDVSVAVTGDIGVNLFGIVDGGITGTTTTSYSQQTGSTDSITLSATTSNTDIVRGPASSKVGVDHDADVIWVWLNPMAIEYMGPNTAAWGGYAFNAADDTQTMEVIPLYVAWLKDPTQMPADVAARLARSWDPTGLGGLTAADYAVILAADPLATSASYNPNTDPSHRFDLTSNSTVPYIPASAGLQPSTWQGSLQTQTTTSLGQNSQTSYSVGFTLTFASQITWIAEVAEKIVVSNTYTTTDSWSSSINTQTGKTASYSITGPQSTDGYTGPVSFEVWRDNIYGSFMFYPVQ